MQLSGAFAVRGAAGGAAVGHANVLPGHASALGQQYGPLYGLAN